MAKKIEKPKIVKITPEQLQMLTKAVRESNLSSEIADMLLDNVSGNRWLVDSLEKGQLTIMKLRKLFHITTETQSNRRKNATTDNNINESTNDAEPRSQKNTTQSGHGRLSADAYAGAEVWDMDVPGLRPGDTCPEEACDGRLRIPFLLGLLANTATRPEKSVYASTKNRCHHRPKSSQFFCLG